ncbi:MAG: phytoene/squalene synthase family protein [Chthonomonadales bacterium]|nr:phytoene/squalene synthase family protein [Chthonomonadales bacterium]
MTEAAVRRSYTYCTELTRVQAANFYQGFRLLPKDKRDGLCAIYAFMRIIDDVTDTPSICDEEDGTSDRSELLDDWSRTVSAIYRDALGRHPILPALHHTVHRYAIPEAHLQTVIQGVATDLHTRRYPTFAELETYCYQVAGVVGLICLHIWGCEDLDASTPLAISCGTAFQLTNILRDVREDADRNRIYLPLEDLNAYGIPEDEFIRGRDSERIGRLLAMEAARAESYFASSRPLLEMVDIDSRGAFAAMYGVYRTLLRRIGADPIRILTNRISLSAAEKLQIVRDSLLFARTGRLTTD